MFNTSPLTVILLYLIYFFDLAGIIFAFVLIPPLILDGTIVVSSWSVAERNTLIGFLLASYPVGQFIAAPILGDLSDRFGRRTILIFSCFATGFTFCLTGVAVIQSQLLLLFVSRFLAGLSAGNMTVAQVSVGDVVKEEVKGKFMSLFSSVGGLAWTVGPFIALVLSNSSLVSWFAYDTPFWFLGCVFLFCSLYLYFRFYPTHMIQNLERINLIKSYKALLSVFKFRPIRTPLVISIYVMIGWLLYQGFLAPYLIERFHFSKDYEGLAYAVSSLAWLLGGLVNTFILIRWIPVRHILYNALIISALAILCYNWIESQSGVWVVASVSNFMMSITWGSFFILFSQLAPMKMQGKVFGCSNAGFAFGSAVSPALAGFLVNLNINLPFTVGAVTLLVMGLFFILRLKQMK